MKQKKYGKKIALGVGLGIAAGAAYLLTGKRGAKNRATLKKVATKVKEEIVHEAGKIKDITIDQYEGLIKKAAERYKEMDPEDFKRIAQELKKKVLGTLASKKEKRSGAKGSA